MKSRTQIEDLVARKLHKAVLGAVHEAIAELNAAGHRFVPAIDPSMYDEWRDEAGGLLLSINGYTSASCRDEAPPSPADPVAGAFLARAQSGRDKAAALLMDLEADLNNGGYSQLHVNKGLPFMRKAALELERIGAQRNLALLREALALAEAHAEAVAGFEALHKGLRKLDAKFNRLKESIPALYAKHHGDGE